MAQPPMQGKEQRIVTQSDMNINDPMTNNRHSMGSKTSEPNAIQSSRKHLAAKTQSSGLQTGVHKQTFAKVPPKRHAYKQAQNAIKDDVQSQQVLGS